MYWTWIGVPSSKVPVSGPVVGWEPELFQERLHPETVNGPPGKNDVLDSPFPKLPVSEPPDIFTVPLSSNTLNLPDTEPPEIFAVPPATPTALFPETKPPKM